MPYWRRLKKCAKFAPFLMKPKIQAPPQKYRTPFLSAVEKIHISILELKDDPLNLLFPLLNYMRYLGFGIEVWLIPLGLCNTNLN